MLRVYRGIIAAIAGLIAALAVSFGSVSATPQQYSGVGIERPAIAKDNSRDAQPKNGVSNGASASVVVLQTAEKATDAEKREKDAAQHDAADLEAQQSAADAAQRAAASAERQEVPAFVQIWLASIGTFIALIALVTSIKTTRRAERSNVAQLRPYVCVKSADLNRIYDQKTRKLIAIEMHMVWTNSGQTPTRKIRSGIDWQLFPELSIPDDFKFPKTGGDRSARDVSVGPGMELRSVAVIMLDDLMKVWRKTHALYYWAWVEYGDFLDDGARHRTETCSRLDIITDPSVVDPDPHFLLTLHTMFNGADSDCYHRPDPEDRPGLPDHSKFHVASSFWKRLRGLAKNLR